jgi:hypothetical protein
MEVLRSGWLFIVLAGCYAPQPPGGSPCVQPSDCPSPLICSPATMTCEVTAGEVDASTLADTSILVDAAIPLIDGCTPAPEVCGDGIDQSCDGSDPACAANDSPQGAIDVTDGGTFSGELRDARDDVAANGCGANGGRDLFYKVNLAAPEVFYVDTFGSSFDSVVRVYAKPCTMVGSGAGALACENDSCGGEQSKLAVELPAGESCIVVDQAAGTETTGEVALRVIPGGRDGLALAGGASTVTGDTCDAANTSEPLDQNCDAPGSGGKDHAYFMTTCPGETLRLDAETCTGATWDTVLYVRRVSGAQLGCNDDDCDGLRSRINNVTIANGPLYFLIIDGFDPGECGDYDLVVNLRP